ncbi:hypothetical protein BGW39_005526 [Mortierella sp. 14UC]|nr:hypothetical protein BGW39_005526 [Mortierella sp. 14UC]
MKFTILALSAVAIASYTNVQGLPAFIKRAIDGDAPTVIKCFALAVTGTPFTPECTEAAKFNIGIVQSITLKSLNIDFRSSVPTISSNDLSVTLLDIGVPWAIVEASEKATIFNGVVDDAGNGAVGIADFAAGPSPATVNGNIISSKVPSSPLIIAPASADGFVDFVVSLVTKPSYTFTIKGFVGGKFGLPAAPPSTGAFGKGINAIGGAFASAFGPVTVSDVGFQSTITLAGFDGLKDVAFAGMVASTKDANGFSLTWTIKIVNPSQLTVYLGKTTFSTLDATGLPVGDSVIADFTILPGDNQFTVLTTGKDVAVLDGLMANGGSLSFVGTATSNSSPYVNKALAALKFAVTVTKSAA